MTTQLPKLDLMKSHIWLRSKEIDTDLNGVTMQEMTSAVERYRRFESVLTKLFDGDWDGKIQSDLKPYPHAEEHQGHLLVKCDATLPMTGSVKARGGVYELLCYIEQIGLAEGLIEPNQPYDALATEESKKVLSRYGIVVASTGNLGFSIGLVARRFGMAADVHMSYDAKEWKKERLRKIGARVVEHDCDYELTVAKARDAAKAGNSHFVDDERSRDLFVGYTGAAFELRDQLNSLKIEVSAERPLVVYLPCGVGGAPGGIAYGLRAIFGDFVYPVFVEPVASACFYLALIGGGKTAVSVYDAGLDNQTVADGLAVPRASELVLQLVGGSIDGAIAIPDTTMAPWVARVWKELDQKLEPSAASGFVAYEALVNKLSSADPHTGRLNKQALMLGTHIVWTTGGAHLPEDEFTALLNQSAASV